MQNIVTFVFGQTATEVEQDLARWLGELEAHDHPTGKVPPTLFHSSESMFTLFSPERGPSAATVVLERHADHDGRARPAWARALSRSCGWVLWMSSLSSRHEHTAHAFYQGVRVETATAHETDEIVRVVAGWHRAITSCDPHWRPAEGTLARSVVVPRWRPFAEDNAEDPLHRALFADVEIHQLAPLVPPPHARWRQLLSPIAQIPFVVVDGELPAGWVVNAARGLERAAVELDVATTHVRWTSVGVDGAVTRGVGAGVAALAQALTRVTIVAGEFAELSARTDHRDTDG